MSQYQVARTGKKELKKVQRKKGIIKCYIESL